MKCSKCGNPASKYNKQGFPVCARHLKTKIRPPKCPNCRLEMVVREGKFGRFLGCPAFPMRDRLQGF